MRFNTTFKHTNNLITSLTAPNKPEATTTESMLKLAEEHFSNFYSSTHEKPYDFNYNIPILMHTYTFDPKLLKLYQNQLRKKKLKLLLKQWIPKGHQVGMVDIKTLKKAIPLILDLATKYTTTEISTTADKRLFSSIMTLIPKSSKSNDITNYRPITIQNTVIRLISSLFNHRIQNYIAEISQFNQMGFIKGRDISAAASKFKIIYDMLQTPEYENYFILNVDYSKAFDTVNKTYLSNVVQAVGLGVTS